jgi:hypothetical protein
LFKKYESAESPERRLKKKTRRAHLRSSSDALGDLGGSGSPGGMFSHLRQESLMGGPLAPGTPRADDNISESSSDSIVGPDDPEYLRKKLREKRALWEANLPGTGKPRKEANVIPTNKEMTYTFIESRQSPEKTYEKRELERINKERIKKSLKRSLKDKLTFRT